MFLLDTNIVSELMREEPAPQVIEWMNRQVVPTLFLSSVVLAELETGIALMPAGRRRQGLTKTLHLEWLPAFEGRILPLTDEDAPYLAQAAARSRKAGVPMEFADAALAAQALRNKLTLATRNTKDFAACGVPLLNPWAKTPAKKPAAG